MSIQGVLAKTGVTALAVTAIAMAPLSASAAQVGTLTLQVTDCQTGQPIPAGYAYFSQTLFGAVAPIDNGVAGPVGLGRYRWQLTVTSPGYRPEERVIQGSGAATPVRTLALCLHHVKGSPVHLLATTYGVAVTCSPASGQLCNPPYSTPVSSADIVEVQFTAASTNCSAITLDFQMDGFDVYTSDQLGPGDITPVVDVGPVLPGTHTLTVQATGVTGGCNVGTLTSWGGSLTVWTVMPVGPTFKDQCRNGGWASFSAFQNQHLCITYVLTAGTHI
ncbi:MAG TPA: hypothetical protein VHW94_07175 [Candidatus Dormibacteraeota bacterium]|nr:hypothetical protein [Candidatus Dormibacteraeota bacterium]